MSIPKFNPRNIVLIIIIIAVAGIRLAINLGASIGPLANYTPLAAMALFGGAYFTGNIKPYAFPLLTLLVSDVILSYTVYASSREGILYGGWYYTYGAFALMAVCGKYMLQKVTVQRVVIAAIAVVCIHWIVTDFGVWLDGTTYPKTLAGFNACLTAAIPFEGRLLTSTIMYSSIMFGLFELMQQKYPRLQLA
jgi:hypothetical protein